MIFFFLFFGSIQGVIKKKRYVHSVGSTCRMGLIRRALDSVRSQLFNELSLDIFGPFVTSPDNFEVKEVVSKTGHWGGLTVRQDKKLFRCRMTTRVGALQSPELGASFRYFKHMCMTSRKFFRGL